MTLRDRPESPSLPTRDFDESMSRRLITLIDPSVGSGNIGDQIIMDAVRQELADLLSAVRTVTVSSQQYLTRFSRSVIRQSDFSIMGGTNCVSSHMWIRGTWSLSLLDALLCRRIVLMGCGWYQFQNKPDFYTRWLLRRILSRDHVHSVRDSYTAGMLRSIGIHNVVNTGCPTLWKLTEEGCRGIRTTKGDCVLASLNTFFRNRKLDGALLKTLEKHYAKIYLWPQNHADYSYARQFGVDLEFLTPTLVALDDFLSNQPGLDYVGNRLHGGIRALQHGVRTVIVEVDNRARTMGADFGLPTIERDALDRVGRWIEGSAEVELTLPHGTIEEWKKQFHA